MTEPSHSPEWEADCLRWRGKVLTGRCGHWCPDWDDLPIDETSLEWPCACAKELLESAPPIAPLDDGTWIPPLIIGLAVGAAFLLWMIAQ